MLCNKNVLKNKDEDLKSDVYNELIKRIASEMKEGNIYNGKCGDKFTFKEFLGKEFFEYQYFAKMQIEFPCLQDF